MNGKLIAGGCAGVLVALGFVFPQISQLRMTGALGPGGIVLLLLGILGTLGGLWCVVRGTRRRASTPAS